MRELRPLRGPCRPRGVEDHGRIVVRPLHDLGPRPGLAHDALELSGLDQHALGAGVIGARLRILSETVPGKKQPGAGVAQVERDLAPLEQHVHRDHYAAGAQYAEVADGEVGDVRQHDPHTV